MIACLNLPYFATSVERRNNAALENKALVIGGKPWEPRPVYAFSGEVAKHGVRPGMSLRLVHVLSPHSQFMPAFPPRYLGASGEITDILTEFTHLIEPEALWLPAHDMAPSRERARAKGSQVGWGPAFGRSLPARFTVDLESLPTAEALSLSQEIGKSVRQNTHLAPAIGLAQSTFAAQIAAALTRPNYARSVPAGEEAAFLAPRTVHFLPLGREMARKLSLLGIHTLGQLAALPGPSLQTHFGPELAAWRRLAQGKLSQVAGFDGTLTASVPLQPMAQGKQERLAQSFEEPVADSLTLERVLARMGVELAGRLQAKGLEGRTLQIVWETESAARPRQVQGISRPGNPLGTHLSEATLTRRSPTADPQKLTDSLHELFQQACLKGTSLSEREHLGRGLIALEVTLSDLVPGMPWQLSLFEPPRAGGSLQEIITNVSAKHGAGALFRPVLTDRIHPLQERRFQIQELAPL